MKAYKLNLGFKGNRNYIQGGDIFNAIQTIAREVVEENAWVKHIAFRGFAKNACDFILDRIENVPGNLVRATCNISFNKKLIPAVIIETQEKITKRYPFDESKITKESLITGSAIKQISRAGYTDIEEIVALTKFLHNQILPVEHKRWIFSQLDLNIPLQLNEIERFTIDIKQNLGNRMTVSEISQHDNIVGKIKFTVVDL